MIISCIGDSLTEGDYGIFGKNGIANVHSENYPYFLSKLTKSEVRNFGKCGFSSTAFLKYYRGGNVDVAGSDIIIVMLGTNGGMSPDQESEENKAYKALISELEKDAPKAKIFLCTPPHATENPEFSNFGYANQVENAVKFIRKYAEENGKALIDVANCPYFTAETENIMQPNDGLHFGKLGYEKLAEFISAHL